MATSISIVTLKYRLSVLAGKSYAKYLNIINILTCTKYARLIMILQKVGIINLFSM